MDRLEIGLGVAAFVAFVVGIFLLFDYSFAAGSFLIALGFFFVVLVAVSIRSSDTRTFLVPIAVWILLGVGVWLRFGWYAHLP
ncbi:MAG: hypothetical protein WCB18_04575 [Thermoplasmata archaeon]